MDSLRHSRERPQVRAALRRRYAHHPRQGHADHRVGTRRVFGGNIIRQPGFMNEHYVVGGDLRGSDFVMNNVFWVSSSPTLTKPMMDYMIEVIRAWSEE